MAGKFVHFFLGGTVATAGIAGIFALAQPTVEEAGRFASSQTRAQAKVGDLTKEGVCEAQAKFSQQLNSYFSDSSNGKNPDFAITKGDCLKLLTAKQEVAKASGCCDTYNGKAVTYKLVINDPAQKTTDALGLPSSAQLANEAAEKMRRKEEVLPRRMSSGCCQFDYSGS